MAEADGAQALLACRWLGTEGPEYQGIALKSSTGVYAFMYALLLEVLE
jgi:hypothetical protein